MFTIYQNDDFKCTIQARNPKTGLPIDLSAFTGIGVWLTYDDGVVLKRFSSNVINIGGTTMSGFSQLNIVDEANGKFMIILESSETKVAKEGMFDLQVKYQYTDSDVSDGRFHKCGRPIHKFANIVEVSPSTQDLL
jgi:hypothetical protein